MATDAERREVARRLRESAGNGEVLRDVFLEEILAGDTGLWFAEDIEIDTLLYHLADLIEPVDRNDELCAHCDYCDYCDLPECSEQDGYSFKPKGYVDLLVLADKTIRSARHDMEICGDTVPAWYAAGRLEAVAQSIREILGVES